MSNQPGVVGSSLQALYNTEYEWLVFHIDPHGVEHKRKLVGRFVQDVDGDWLFFFEKNGRGWQRHSLADLSALFSRFIPNTYPEV